MVKSTSLRGALWALATALSLSSGVAAEAADVVAVWSSAEHEASLRAANAVGEALAAAGYRLADREAIAAILKEQQLTAAGLTDRAAGVRVGQLLAARYVVLAEPLTLSELQVAVSLRVIETGTGVILADELAEPGPERPVEAAAQQATEVLLARMALPTGTRRYVAVLPFTPTAHDDPALVRAGGALTSLVRAGVARLPQVVLVEREQVSAVTREQAIAGRASGIHGSGWMIEGTLGPEGTGWEVNVRLTRVGDNGEPAVYRVPLTRGDVAAARAAAVERLAAALEVAPGAATVDRTHEAWQLAQRARRLAESKQYELALQNVEAIAALGLPPTALPRLLPLINYAYVPISDRNLPSRARLQLATAVTRLHDRYARACTDNQFQMDGVWHWQLAADIYASRKRITDQDLPWLDEFRQAHEDLITYCAQRTRALGRVPILENSYWIDRAYFLHRRDAAEFLRQSLPLLQECAEQMGRDSLVGLSSGHGGLYGVLKNIVETSVESGGPGITAAELRPLAIQLQQAPVVYLQLIGRLLQFYGGSDADRQAAFDWVVEAYLTRHNPHLWRDVSVNRQLDEWAQALIRKHLTAQDRWEPWVRQHLDRLAAGDLDAILCRPQWLASWWCEAWGQGERAWAEAVLAHVPEPTFDDDRATRWRKRAAREVAEEHLARLGKQTIEQADSPTSPWRRVQITELQLSPKPEGGPLLLAVDASDAAAAADRQLAVLWQHSSRMVEPFVSERDLSVLRTSIRGGAWTTIGRATVRRKFEPNELAVAGDTAFLSVQGGLAVFRDGGGTVLGTESGLPHTHVTAIAALPTVTLVNTPGALLKLAPPYQRFETIASRQSIAGRNALDGNAHAGSLRLVPDVRSNRVLLLGGTSWCYDAAADALTPLHDTNQLTVQSWDRRVLGASRAGMPPVLNRVFEYRAECNRFVALPHVARAQNRVGIDGIPIEFGDFCLINKPLAHHGTMLVAVGPHRQVWRHPNDAGPWSWAYQIGDTAVIFYPNSRQDLDPGHAFLVQRVRPAPSAPVPAVPEKAP